MSMRANTPKIINNNNSPNHESLLTMHRTVTIVTPQRSNSLDYLNFEEKRQLIASSLSLSEILQCGPAAAAAHAAKEIAETAVIGKFCEDVRMGELEGDRKKTTAYELYVKEMRLVQSGLRMVGDS